MIAIVDYDMGNVGSIKNMIEYIGGEDVIITSDEKIILEADYLILPGVGSFDMGMKNLHEKKLIEPIKYFANVLKRPILGICLGMQLLGKCSQEGELAGLDLIPFKNVRFDFKDNIDLKIPHMGWDIISIRNEDSPLVIGMNSNSRFYFVHSYYAVCDNTENILMECDYGINFTAAVFKDNIYGVQFHPEKSHFFGMKILENFMKV